jgi:hypothetical protein
MCLVLGGIERYVLDLDTVMLEKTPTCRKLLKNFIT